MMHPSHVEEGHGAEESSSPSKTPPPALPEDGSPRRQTSPRNPVSSIWKASKSYSSSSGLFLVDMESQMCHNMDEDHTVLTTKPSYDSTFEDPQSAEMEEIVFYEASSSSHSSSPDCIDSSFLSIEYCDEQPSSGDAVATGTHTGVPPLHAATFTEAQEQHLPGPHKSRHILRGQLLRLAVKFGLVLLLVTLSLGAVLVVHRNRAYEDKMDRLETAVQFLTLTRVSSAQDLHLINSPQQQAISWMMLEDPAQRPVPKALVGVEAALFVQRYSLAVFYFATGGAETWKDQLNFLTGSHECDWHTQEGTLDFLGEKQPLGVVCNPEMLVSGINIPRNELVGSLPLEFFELRELTSLSLGHNAVEWEFDGLLDSFWQSFSFLQYVDLQYNRIGGRVSSAFGNLLNLQVLILSGNALQGPLPWSLSQLDRLHALAIDHNALSGPLDVLDLLSNLEYVYADHNMFSHMIDGSFGARLTRLREMDLSNNDLFNNASQPLPSTLFRLPSLEVLDLSYNDLRGSLPIATNGTASVLEYLSLRGNKLGGQVSSVLVSSLARLVHLDIEENELVGTLPDALAGLTQLEYLAFGSNQFSYGTGLPKWVWSLTKLRHLSARDLGVHGELPLSIANMRDLVTLDLSGNEFYGDIPFDFWNAPNLLYLLLHNNALDGQVLPSSTVVVGVSKLSVATVFGNPSLSGSLEAVCEEMTQISLLATDCALECPCCQTCCVDGDEDCFQPELETALPERNGSWGSDFVDAVTAFDAALGNGAP